MQKTQGFLFQHWDSRGGSIFVANPNFFQAATSYMNVMGWSTDELTAEQRWNAVWADNPQPTVIFHDEPLEEGELLEEMTGAGGNFRIAKLKKYFMSWTGKGWRPSDDGFQYYRLFKGKIKAADLAIHDEMEKWKVAKMDPRMDDDAYGLIYQP